MKTLKISGKWQLRRGTSLLMTKPHKRINKQLNMLNWNTDFQQPLSLEQIHNEKGTMKISFIKVEKLTDLMKACYYFF